jgi:hypothetical protein
MLLRKFFSVAIGTEGTQKINDVAEVKKKLLFFNLLIQIE